MKNMKRIGLLVAIAVVVLGVGFRVTAAPTASDAARVAALVGEMQGVTPAKLEEMPAIQIQPYHLPGPSVDVMRVRLEESYTVKGVGKDDVELTGWIAVRHGASRPAPGFKTVSWGTAITDTEFVGLELKGESKLFGPVHVSLDSSRPAIGAVGRISVPERAVRTLLVANQDQQPGSSAPIDPAGSCRAPVNVRVAMPQLGLEMKTKEPAVWYSEVTTIPPVGHVASVTVEPVPLISADREVATLVSGTVKFREVVRSVPLSKNHQVVVASLGK
jgi:uncharacterized protein DUF6073